MENKTINTIEINGKSINLSSKMVEIPRQKKIFETSKAYSKYLEEILKKAFPYDEKLHDNDDYDYFINYNVYKLWEAADENKITLKNKVSRKFKEVIDKLPKRNKEKNEKDSEKKSKTTITSKLLKPFKYIGKIAITPITLGKKALQKLKKGFNLINSKMPWSKKNDEDDLEKMLEEATENENDNNMAEEMLNEAEKQLEKEAQEELKEGVKEELAKEKEEKAKELIEKLKMQVKELEKERELLKSKIEIYKKQPERDKVWEKYFKEEQQQEEIKNKIDLAKNSLDNSLNVKYASNKDGKTVWARPKFKLTKINEENIKNACKQPYTIVKDKNSISVSKKGIKEYQDSQKLSETEGTITITGSLYENLLYSEYEFNVHMRDMAVNVYKVPFYKVDYNYDGLIKRNKEKVDGKIVNASVVLTKKRYEELTENAAKYFSLMAEVSNYSSNRLAKNNQKKLVK